MKAYFKNNKRGFVQLIFIIIIAVVILTFFGLNPKVIWTDHVLPIIQFTWDAAITILTFVVDLAIKLAHELGIGN
ncbi:hypothetical protein H6775_00610 [Candidatus Nomurabacteria bacterium]|nr:hypothetical protein [Candidatus Nomurabacteria bacterium]